MDLGPVLENIVSRLQHLPGIVEASAGAPGIPLRFNMHVTGLTASDRAEITRVRYHGGMQSFLVPPAFYLLPLLLTQTLSGSALLDALRHGGYVIVMRHASSPREAPDKAVANPDNVNLERQLDEAGRSSAVAMGTAIRQLKIPIGEVFTSPTYRAMETVRLARLSNPLAQSELGDGGQSMQAASDTQAAWLKDRVSRVSAATNTVIVTHMPNISRAFPEWGAVADGEAVVLKPDGKGRAPVVGRIKIDEWPRLR